MLEDKVLSKHSGLIKFIKATLLSPAAHSAFDQHLEYFFHAWWYS